MSLENRELRKETTAVRFSNRPVKSEDIGVEVMV